MLEYNEFEDRFIDKFDVDSFTSSFDEVTSNELMLYPMFHRQLIMRRLTDITRLWNKDELKELPVGAMLHLIDDNFLMNKPIVFVPDVKGYGLTRNPYRKFMYHVTMPPPQSWVKDIEPLVLPQQGVIPTITNYRKTYQRCMRTCNGLKDMPGPARPQVQSVISYASLYRARIFGLMRPHRRFKYVMSQLLNQIALQPERMHFIPIPVGDKNFDRGMFLRTFKVHDRSSIRLPEDNWYLFCMHLLGFVHGKTTPSIFENIPKEMWDKIHFVLYSKTKVLTLRLDILKEFNKNTDIIMIRLIKQLGMLAESGTVQTTIDYSETPAIMDVVEDKSLPDIVPPETPFEETPNESIPEEEPVPAKAEPVEETPKEVPKVETPLIKIPGIKQPVQVDPTEPEEPSIVQVDIDELDEVGTVDDKWTEVHDEVKYKEEPTVTHNVPEYTEPINIAERRIFNRQQLKELDEQAQAVIADADLTPARRKRAETLANAYKTIKIEGTNVTLESVLQEVPDDSVNENKIECLQDEVADPSMLKSSVSTFEADYMNKMFTKDLVAGLVSFNKVGMFLKDIKIADASDRLNNKMMYTVKYEDINHKEHTIRFTLPKVDNRGFCLINGTLKVLKKQRVPNPICKIGNTRVKISSDYNRYLIERNTTVAHSFIYYLDRIIKKSENQIIGTLGTFNYTDYKLPYEYTAIAKKYSKLVVKPQEGDAWFFTFDFSNWKTTCKDELGLNTKMIEAIEHKGTALKSVFVGISKTYQTAYMSVSGELVIYDLVQDTKLQTTTMIDLLCDLTGNSLNNLSEWVDFKLLSKTIPVVFALCYRFGLTYMLKYLKAKYTLYDKGQRFSKQPSDIIIKFADKTLVIPRAPLTNSLIFAGLNAFELKNVTMSDMDSKDIYYELIQSKKISIHNLKGIDNYFDYFVDPITADVLHQMKEPTNAKDLLIRAVQLLTTEDHKPGASSVNFRYRSYERMNSAIYKVLSRTHAAFKYKVGGTTKFSIADYEVQSMVVQDQLMENVDMINPINDIKYQSEYSHAGFGGRASTDTFMVDDRQFPDDGVGIMSEATVDSSKTAFAASMTLDPSIQNLRGMTVTKPRQELAPSQLLSPTTILVPGATQDDGKRANFINIHLSHYEATQVMDVYRVRSSFEKVVAHRTRPPFAYAAEEDGVIQTIDNDAKVLKVLYKSGKAVACQFGEEYLNNGGAGYYCSHKIAINDFKEKDKVKKGDILIYNERFFKPDPYSKQVDWCLGTEAHLICMESNNTLDDGNCISNSLAEKLRFNPVHVRDIVLTKNTTIHKYAAVGTEVFNIDPLIVFDQSEMDDNLFGKLDEQAVDLLAKLNRSTPKAKHTGKVVKLDVFFKCDPSELSPSLKGIINPIYKNQKRQAKTASGANNFDEFDKDLQIKYTDRIGITDLDQDTVILRFYIQQNMEMDAGSKIEFLSSLKSITSYIQPEPWQVEDGSITADAIYSAIGINQRIINSPIINGMSARVIENIESQILDLYFNK